jgi:hypothetical protein
MFTTHQWGDWIEKQFVVEFLIYQMKILTSEEVKILP